MFIQNIKSKDKEEYTSKSKRNECANEECKNKKRNGSKYCQTCSDNFKKLNEKI